LRWARGARRCRPLGYIGEIFTKPTVPAVVLWVLVPAWGALAGLAIVMRLAVVWMASTLVSGNCEARYAWWMLPAEDVAAFVTWVAGFFGNRLTWRGHKLTIGRDGTIRTLS
jgi:ceramide glucosyltransferase